MSTFAELSNDQLADQIVTWTGRIAAGEAQLLALIAEFDGREAWGGPGLLSCAHWLSWRTGLGLVAAREKVRVARVLDDLPLVREAQAAGRLSYCQVRAVTRVAAEQDQQRWIDLARSATAGQLERLVRGVRRVRKLEEDAADPELAAWRLQARKSYDADGNAVYRIVLPAEQAAVLDAALEAVRADVDRAGSGDADASAEATSPQGGQLPRLTGRGRRWPTPSWPWPARRSTGRSPTARQRPVAPARRWAPRSTRSPAGAGCVTASCCHPRHWRPCSRRSQVGVARCDCVR